MLRATIVFQNDEHNRYWQVKSLCDTPLWCTAPYLSLIHTLTSDIFIKMCSSVDYSITAWDNHDINESKLPSAAKGPLWKNEDNLFRYSVYTFIKHRLNVYNNWLLDRKLHPCAKASLILKSQRTRHVRQDLHWDFGFFFCESLNFTWAIFCERRTRTLLFKCLHTKSYKPTNHSTSLANKCPISWMWRN